MIEKRVEMSMDDGSSPLTKRRVLWAVMFAPFFTPAAYTLGEWYSIWVAMTCVIGGASILLLLVRYPIRMHWLCFAGFYCSYYCLSTLMANSDGSATTIAINLIRGIGLISLFSYCMQAGEEDCIVSFILAGTIMCGIHYGTFLAYGDVVGGMRAGVIEAGRYHATTQHWLFFTHDNGSLFYFLPFITVCWYYAFYYRSKYLPVAAAITAATLAMYIILWSVTAMVCMGIVAVSLAVIARNPGKNPGGMAREPLRLGIYAWLLLCITVIALNTSGAFEAVSSFFGKADTVNSRVDIWNRTLDWAIQQPLFGNGFEEDVTTFLKIGVNHCHNLLLQLVYTGGIVTALLYLAALLSCCRRKGSYITTGGLFIVVCCVCLLVASCFDWYAYMYLFNVPFLLYRYASKLESS